MLDRYPLDINHLLRWVLGRDPDPTYRKFGSGPVFIGSVSGFCKNHTVCPRKLVLLLYSDLDYVIEKGVFRHPAI